MILNLVRRTAGLTRTQKRLILLGHDLAAMIIALWGAFSTRLGEPYFPNSPPVLAAAALSFAIGLAALYRLQVYHFVLRYFDLQSVSRIFSGAAIASAVWVIVVYFIRAPIVVDGAPILVPRSVGFIYCGFLFLLLFMGRYMLARTLVGAGRDLVASGARNIAIYGANAAGISLGESVRGNAAFRLIAFIDDDPALHGQIIGGIPIHSSESLLELVRRYELTEVFFAMPNASRSQRLAAISRVTDLHLTAMTIPAPEEIVSGRFTVSDVRPINVGDLLRRDPVEPLMSLIREAVEGQCILITGAGGSIGSEICRQVLQAGPEKLLLLDHSEFALYAIEQQLIDARGRVADKSRPAIVSIVGSMLNQTLVERLFQTHRVDTVYHAAAYKHVPLLENNEVVGVENNVLGTQILAEAAIKSGLTRFTMISTDKAVRPKSVMGASKRVAELVVQAYANRADCRTHFGIVRFGNVLDSSGSVVQKFRKQIRDGGPITVTHRDITRFFMSIPEATQLVLQASAMAGKGEVFVLDMGEPIRIADLARDMVNLTGMTVRDDHNPDGDIEIHFTGLRPGEKLHEELFIGNEMLETDHPRIRMARERFLSLTDLEGSLAKLRSAIEANDALRVRANLADLIAPDQGNLGSGLDDIDAAPPEMPGLIGNFG